ncbi:hypothetical protein EI94DRAFT_1858251 [Lactarius quietus]|nr:hypothetical protein EI94DRAFT_1858251 [Lactarius quietus]
MEPPDGDLSSVPPLEQSGDSPIQSEAGNSESSSTLTIELFPHGQPGAPVADTPQGVTVYESSQDTLGESVWAPFRSQCDWELAHWVKTSGSTSSAVNMLLRIPGLVEKLGLSFHTSKELNDIIDNQLPSTPTFKTHDVVIGGEDLQFHYRDLIPCIRALFSNPEFAHDLICAPERHYTDSSCKHRIYNEMHTGDWWWSVQMALESHQPGATVIPIIISSDKTLLTLFRGKTAYPIYMGIGNIPKDIRRKPSCSVQLLIGYIPTSKLEGITNQAARRRAHANLFHSCMARVLNPLKTYGETGLMMMSRDRIWRRCHPIFATFVGDYPEQTLVTCTYNGHCPKCSVPHDRLGEFNNFSPRDHIVAIDTYLLADEDVQGFNPACRAAGLKPVYHPFWQSLPLTDIFLAITPDILHQLLQGVIKHLVTWLTHPLIFRVTDINTRCRSLPPNHHTTLFTKGLPFSRVTGKEHKNVCRILIGLITDLPIPGGHSSARVVRATHAILDFVYLVQFPSHTTDTLALLEDSLSLFHANKDTFIDLGVRYNFLIPKIHGMLHYKSSITLFGTTDNYNTEQSEQLHIDLTKNAYRATNCKDEYLQMTAWVERQERTKMHAAFIRWRQCKSYGAKYKSVPIALPEPQSRLIKMTLHPTCKAVSFEALAEQYGAVEFQDALADYIARISHPGASAANLRARASDTLIPFRTVPVYHRIKFIAASSTDNSEIVDCVVIRPEQNDTHGRIVPGRFDTVLVRGTQDVIHGNNGHRIAQLRVVFQLSKKIVDDIFPGTTAPIHLAYAEWFSPLSTSRDPNHKLYKVTRSMLGGKRCATVIPVESILGSVHLLPRFGPTPPHWSSFSALEQCNTFYVNPFSDRQNYLRFM